MPNEFGSWAFIKLAIDSVFYNFAALYNTISLDKSLEEPCLKETKCLDREVSVEK